MVKSNDLVGVVLLGGMSSRMGSDKSELTADGLTLAQCATNILKNAGLKHVVISSGNKPCGIEDVIVGKGPLGGIHAVMSHSSNRDSVGFVFLPVDMPMVTTALIKLLVESGCANASVCQFKNWPFPCYFPNNAKVIEALEQALNENLLAVKGLLNKLNAIELETQESSQHVFMNINTPDQWLKYKQLTTRNLDRGQ